MKCKAIFAYNKDVGKNTRIQESDNDKTTARQKSPILDYPYILTVK